MENMSGDKEMKATRKPRITGSELPNIPWEDRPEGYEGVIWRSRRNPIIPRNLIPSANSIFNSAVVPFAGEYAGVFRCDDKRRHMRLHRGRSGDGINWDIDNEPLSFFCENPEIDRKSTRLNSSHVRISYAVFCSKKKTTPPKTSPAPPATVARLPRSPGLQHSLELDCLSRC